MRDQVGDSLASIDSVVIVLVVSSAALAFVVLYNLTHINIGRTLPGAGDAARAGI